MNPLNCIIGNSKIVLKRLIENNKKLDEKGSPDDYTMAMIEKNEQTLEILNSVMYAG